MPAGQRAFTRAAADLALFHGRAAQAHDSRRRGSRRPCVARHSPSSTARYVPPSCPVPPRWLDSPRCADATGPRAHACHTGPATTPAPDSLERGVNGVEVVAHAGPTLETVSGDNHTSDVAPTPLG